MAKGRNEIKRPMEMHRESKGNAVRLFPPPRFRKGQVGNRVKRLKRPCPLFVLLLYRRPEYLSPVHLSDSARGLLLLTIESVSLSVMITGCGREKREMAEGREERFIVHAYKNVCAPLV